MPRKATNTENDIVDAAMRQFWSHGYHATSMDELVKVAGASRHAIYSVFGSKQDLYLRSFDAYQRAVVTPALEDVENAECGMGAIESFLERQISVAADMGLPGPGCFVANAATETAPHDPLAAAKVDQHHHRLKCGFTKALRADAPQLPASELEVLAEILVTFAQGLWSMSRTVASAEPLKKQTQAIVSLIRARTSN